MEDEKSKEEMEDWKVYEALCRKTPTNVSRLFKKKKIF